MAGHEVRQGTHAGVRGAQPPLPKHAQADGVAAVAAAEEVLERHALVLLVGHVRIVVVVVIVIVKALSGCLRFRCALAV